MNVLAIFAHPDDEALGCGGALARHAAAGHRCDVLLVADGETARPAAASAAIGVRRAAAEAAARALGCRPPSFLDLPDNRLDGLTLLDVVQRIELAAHPLAPDIVYTHHLGDLNVDHEIVARAVLTAFRPQPGGSVRAIYGCEVLSSTGWRGAEGVFAPTRFVEIDADLGPKLAALAAYAPEMRPAPHARSFEAVTALARLRGAMLGVSAAEAFVVHRELIRLDDLARL